MPEERGKTGEGRLLVIVCGHERMFKNPRMRVKLGYFLYEPLMWAVIQIFAKTTKMASASIFQSRFSWTSWTGSSNNV